MRIDRTARALPGLLALGVVLAACGGIAATGTSPDAARDPVTYTGYLTAVHPDRRTVRLELVDVPGGSAAPQPADGEQLQRAWPLADDARATVYECVQACETVAVPVADLADGSARPHHGSEAIFDIVVEDQQVVSIAERDLP